MFGRKKKQVNRDRMVVIESLVRAHNTASGNPVIHVGLSNGIILRTKPDSQIAYDLTEWHVTKALPIPAALKLEPMGRESVIVGVRAISSINELTG